MNPSVSSIIAMAHARDPQCGGSRVLAIDGPAGSGKTTLANALSRELNCQVLHSDDMYEGWNGLSTLNDVLVRQVLVPLAAGKPAGFARWDWERDARVARIEVPAAPWLVIEGVGCANARARHYAALVVWVEAPWDVRLRRGLERDGDQMRAHWEAWQIEEQQHFADNATREAASVILDGTAPIFD